MITILDPEATPVRRERRDAAENRQQILTAARRLFAEQGVEQTSMAEIARAAGVGQGTLYRRYAHKGELCLALLATDLAAFQQRLGASEPPTDQPAIRRLDHLLVEHVQLIEQHLPLMAEVEAAVLRRGPPTLDRPLRRWLHGYITQLLTAAVAEGSMRPIDIAFTADALLAALAPPLYAYQRQEQEYSQARILAGLRDIFISGLAQPR